MKLKDILAYVNYAGAALMISNLFFQWIDPQGNVIEEYINERNMWVKRISVALLAIAATIVTYVLTAKKYLNPVTIRKYRLLMLILGAVGIFITVTAGVSEDYKPVIQNGLGFYLALAGTCIYTAGSVALYFTLRKYL